MYIQYINLFLQLCACIIQEQVTLICSLLLLKSWWYLAGINVIFMAFFSCPAHSSFEGVWLQDSQDSAILPVMKLEGRAAWCDAERPWEILGLYFPSAEPSCTGPVLGRASSNSCKGLGKSGSSSWGWFLHTHKSDPRNKQTKPNKKMLQKNPGPTFSLTVFLIRLVAWISWAFSIPK